MSSAWPPTMPIAPAACASRSDQPRLQPRVDAALRRRQDLEGERLQRVAGQHRRRLVPLDVHRRLAAAQRRRRPCRAGRRGPGCRRARTRPPRRSRSACAGGTRKIAALSSARKARSRLPPESTACRIAAPSVVSPPAAGRPAPPRPGSLPGSATAWNCRVPASIGVRGCRPAGPDAPSGPWAISATRASAAFSLLLAMGAQLGAAGVERDRLLERAPRRLEPRHHLLELGQRRLEAHLRRPASRRPQPCPRSISTRTCAAADAASALRSYPPSRVETIRPPQTRSARSQSRSVAQAKSASVSCRFASGIARVRVEAGRDQDHLRPRAPRPPAARGASIPARKTPPLAPGGSGTLTIWPWAPRSLRARRCPG